VAAVVGQWVSIAELGGVGKREVWGLRLLAHALLRVSLSRR